MIQISVRILLILFFFPIALSAQFPLRHYVHPPKGEVVLREQTVYENVQIDPNGVPLLPARPKSLLLTRFEENRPVEISFFDTLPGGKEVLSTRIDFRWEDGRIKWVKEWVGGNTWAPERPLELHATFLHNYVNGVLDSENVLDSDGKLLSTLKYLPEMRLEGLPLIRFEHNRYDKGELQKGDQYGVQHDTSGRKRLHFQVRDGDTIFYLRSQMHPDGACKMEVYTASARRFEEVTWKISTWYDGMGNPLLVLNEYPKATEESEQYGAIVYRYQYKGDKDWRPGPAVGRMPDPVVSESPAPAKEAVEAAEIVVEPPPPPSEVPGHAATSSSGDRPTAGSGRGPAPKYLFPYKRFQENGKFGCQDNYQRRIIPPDYDEIDLMYHQQGILRVRQGTLWGVVDPENRTVLPIAYTTINPSGNLLLITDQQKKTGVARKDGTMVIPCAYDFLNWDGRLTAFYAQKDGMVTLFDQEGKVLLAPKYSILRGTMHQPDLMVARLGTLFGVVDRTSDRVVIPFEYEELEFEERLMEQNGVPVQILRAVKDGKGGILGLDNHPVVPFDYKWVGLAADRQHFLVRKNDRLGLLRQDLSLAIPIQYFQIFQPVEKVYMTLNEKNLWGVRTAEREVVPEQYVRDSIQVTGKVIRVKDGSQSWLYSQTGAFEPFQYTRWETFARSADGVHTYHLADGRKCLVSNRENDPPAEFYDQQKRYETNHGGAIIVLQRTDDQGQTWYGIRNGELGQAIAPMIYRELDMNVTLRHTDRFTREKGKASEFVCALGRTSQKGPWVLIGSKGTVIEMR